MGGPRHCNTTVVTRGETAVGITIIRSSQNAGETEGVVFCSRRRFCALPKILRKRFENIYSDLIYLLIVQFVLICIFTLVKALQFFSRELIFPPQMTALC